VPTVLDNILETHTGQEPRFITEDIRAVLRSVIRPDASDAGDAVAQIAARAKISPRTVYRVLNPKEGKETISLDLGDRLCLAAGFHPATVHVRLLHSDGRITDYLHNEV